MTSWLYGLIGWVIPGAGHVFQGQIVKGITAATSVLLLFVYGLSLGGHLQGVFDGKDGLLSYVFGIFSLGAGAPYLFCRAVELGAEELAHLPTYEYGNVFLMVAGLLNYLCALDAFDVARGRSRG